MAISSMTGFARAAGVHGAWRLTVELKCVNAKGADIRIRVPAGFDAIESAIRAAIGEGIATRLLLCDAERRARRRGGGAAHQSGGAQAAGRIEPAGGGAYGLAAADVRQPARGARGRGSDGARAGRSCDAGVARRDADAGAAGAGGARRGSARRGRGAGRGAAKAFGFHRQPGAKPPTPIRRAGRRRSGRALANRSRR